MAPCSRFAPPRPFSSWMAYVVAAMLRAFVISRKTTAAWRKLIIWSRSMVASISTIAVATPNLAPTRSASADEYRMICRSDPLHAGSAGYAMWLRCLNLGLDAERLHARNHRRRGKEADLRGWRGMAEAPQRQSAPHVSSHRASGGPVRRFRTAVAYPAPA